MEKIGPYTVRLDDGAFVIDGPTGTFGDFLSKGQADGECDMMNRCYAAGQASSPPSLHIEEHATAMCGDHGGIEGCSCSMCGSPLGPMELTQFCNGCGTPVDWPMADGTVVKSKGRANASSAPSLHIGMGEITDQQVNDAVETYADNDPTNGPITVSRRGMRAALNQFANPNDDPWAANMRLHGKTSLIGIIRSERRDYEAQIAKDRALIQALLLLVPIAKRMQTACEDGDVLNFDNDFDANDAIEYEGKIAAALSMAKEMGYIPTEG